MKHTSTTALRVLLVAALVVATLPLAGCIGRYGYSSSTSGSRGTLAHSTRSHSTLSHSTLPGHGTFPGHSTFPRSGSSSSSDRYAWILEPVVAPAPDAQGDQEANEKEDADQPADDETAAEAGAGGKAAAKEADPLDWPYWRGPEYNSISRETGLPDSLDLDGGEGSNLVWRNEELRGRSTPIVMNGKLYTILRAEPGTPREGEKVVCADAETGKTLWENRFNVWLSDVPDTRVGWSSVVGDPETGNVYALGVCGFFQCIDGDTGKTIWSVPMHERFGLLSTYGGRTNFPVVVDDLVIISGVIIGWGEMAKPEHRFIGFDKRTGDVVWFNSTKPLPEDTTYSAPSLGVFNGQLELVAGGGDGSIWSFQPRTGLPIWYYRFSMRGVNTSPTIDGEVVYAGHSEENIIREGAVPRMGAIAAIKGTLSGDITEKGELWRDEELMIGKSAPLVLGDRVYCVDDRGKLFVLDIKTGEQISRTALGRKMHGSPLYADGKIYLMTEGISSWYVLEPDADRGVKVVNKGSFNGEDVLASPIVSHGRLYVQSSEALYCFEDKTKKHGAGPRPKTAQEAPVSEDEKPAYVQVVPAEVLMQPGRMEMFKARLFNSRGQLLKEADDATFALEGPGELAKGTYLAPSDPVHAAAYVTAQVGGLKGRARIRIVPPLPWTFDFEGLKEPPVTWVGARYRHIIRPLDGNNVMVKITTIPKGTRSRAWFGDPDLSNYTIQADVRGARMDNKLPDIGLIDQGYTLDLQGESQKFEVRTWVPQRRMAKAVDFDWKPDVWYTMKLEVSVVETAESPTGKRATVRGKIWPRGEKEPDAWTVEATDDSPNLSGSPGLYGNAKDAEIYLDNIRVYANGES